MFGFSLRRVIVVVLDTLKFVETGGLSSTPEIGFGVGMEEELFPVKGLDMGHLEVKNKESGIKSLF